MKRRIWVSGYVNNLAISPNGQYILAAHYDSLSLWNFHTGQKIRTYTKTTNMSRSVGFSQDGTKVYLAGTYHDKFWNLDGTYQYSFSHYPFLPGDYSPDGKYAVMAVNNYRNIALWDRSGLLFQFPIQSSLQAIRFTPDSKHFIYADGKKLYLRRVKPPFVKNERIANSNSPSDQLLTSEDAIPRKITSQIENEVHSTGSFLFVNEPQGLLVRNQPSQNAMKLDVLKEYELVKVIESSPTVETLSGFSSHWYKVKHGKKLDKVGWVFGGFLEK
ncbi:MAG: SH3 domain-containing protein [Spirochaetota bacterium]